MAIEIEKKFLIKHIPFERVQYSHKIKQGYIVSDKKKVIRVREKGNDYFITIKGNKIGISRSEFEYKIPESDALELLENFCELDSIIKTRHYVKHHGHTWEIDEFHGENEGLVVAEIELDSEDEQFDIPEWVLEEVTPDPRYYNMNLTVNPFSQWKEK